LHQQELDDYYTPSKDELCFIQDKLRYRKDTCANYIQHQFNAITLLKCLSRLGYFPSLRTVPKIISDHIHHHLKLEKPLSLGYKHSQVLYRHQEIIRNYLKVKSYLNGGCDLATNIAIKAARVHNYPADIINHVLEQLMRSRYELPAYSQIDRLVKKSRRQVNEEIFNCIHQQLNNKIKNKFEKLTIKATRTTYNKLKELPKSTTIKHFKELVTHLKWLEKFGSMESYLKDISQIKLKHFAGEAQSLDASDMRDITEAKRYTLIACLINEMQKRAKDHLVIMLIKHLRKTEEKSKQKLSDLREENKEKTRSLLTLLESIVTIIGKKISPKRIKSVRKNYR
jgi:hypothetical protein